MDNVQQYNKCVRTHNIYQRGSLMFGVFLCILFVILMFNLDRFTMAQRAFWIPCSIFIIIGYTIAIQGFFLIWAQLIFKRKQKLWN